MGKPDCRCIASKHAARLVVVTGGPGAGKTGVLETVRRSFCDHVVVLPHSASIILSAGFPTRTSLAGRHAAQRAIFRVQRELELLEIGEGVAAVIVCDRGTLDGLAYWPTDEASFFAENETTREAEMRRYAAVIHLRAPPAHAASRLNPLHLELALEAAAIDAEIVRAWDGHPRRAFVENTDDFIDEVTRAVATVREEIPPCCRGLRATHPLAAENPAMARAR